jgi:Spy/CpxP family protein refolding chaperone
MKIKTKKILSSFCAALVIGLSFPIAQPVQANPWLIIRLIPAAIQIFGFTAPRVKNIKLTPQQRQELQVIGNESLKEVNSILTKAQRTKLAQSIISGKAKNEVIKSLNLTPAQQQKIEKIVQRYEKQMQILVAQYQTQNQKK